MGMREEFEAAVTIRWPNNSKLLLRINQPGSPCDGDYENPIVHHTWWAWQESRATLVLDFTACNVQHASYNNVDCYSINDVKVIAARHGVGVTVK